MATWREDVVEALTVLGGIGTYQEIYAEVAARRDDLPESWQATIRSTIEQASSDSAVYLTHRDDLFYSVDGIGHGVWGLRSEIGGGRTVAEPATPGGFAGQGYAADSVVRAAIENHAMEVARDYYEDRKPDRMVTLGKPYDLLVQLDGLEIHVEVKGSTRPLDAVTLTKGEVVHARTNPVVHLFVVDSIELTVDRDGTPLAEGGRRRLWTDWAPSSSALEAQVFRYRLGDGVPETLD